MPVLIDEIISVQFFLTCFSVTVLLLWLMVKFKVADSWCDPSILTLFQLVITFVSLSYLSILPLNQIVGFLFFLLILFGLARFKLKPIKIVPENFWMQFSYFLVVIAVLSNVYLTSTKGFIYFVEDSSNARLVYYQGYGMFQRINSFAAPVIAINAFYLLRANRKSLFFFYMIVVAFLLVSLGSKSSLMAIIFFYGAFFKFHKKTETAFLKRNKGKLTLLLLFMFFTSLSMFYLIYQDSFLDAFAYRMISMSDGPFYFYFDHLQQWISYPPMYMFDQLLVTIRAYPDLRYMGLGAKINYYYYDYYDLLNGPNPQIFVESQVMFGGFFWVMYVMVAFAYTFLRKMCASPISFYFITQFVIVLTIDSQYAFSLIFNYIVLAVMMVVFLLLKLFYQALNGALLTATYR